MSDFDDHDLVGAFDEFANNAAGYVRLAGADSVRATVRHRRRVRATALSALAVLVIAVPITTYALTSHGGSSPPVLGAASPSPSVSAVVSTPSVPASIVPPIGPPSIVPPSSAGPPTKAGEITMAELTAAKVTIPAWSVTSASGAFGVCKGGKQQLAGAPMAALNYAGNSSTLSVNKVVYTNLDTNAGNETAALVSCQFGEVAIDQVVAFDRNASGQIVTLGKVAQGVIWSLTARSAGGVTVDISDSEGCCETPTALPLHQTRSYAWTGAHFAQVSGPTSFVPHTQAITLKLVLNSATWSAGNGGTGTVMVTVTNPSTHRTGSILVWDASGGTDIEHTGPGVKIAPALAPGASEKVTITLAVAATDRARDYYVDSAEIGGTGLGESNQYVKYHF